MTEDEINGMDEPQEYKPGKRKRIGDDFVYIIYKMIVNILYKDKSNEK